MKSVKSTLLVSAAAVTVLATATPAFAQVEEIVVTAQKRQQSAQDVPISIETVSGTEMLDRQVAGIEDLTQSMPNVFVSKDTTSNNLYIRGVGSGSNGGFEQAVATFVDGVYHGRARYTQSNLVDVERVEVLRGPQSIYFGNNAIGGAFSVTTNKPNLGHWTGYGQASYEFVADEPIVEVAAGGPLIPDKLAVRVAGRYGEMKGFVRNLTTGGRNPDLRDGFVRFSALLQMSPDWSASFKAEYGKQNSISPFAPQYTDCPPKPPFTTGFGCGVVLANHQETNFDFNRNSIAGERGRIEASEFVATLERDNTNGPGVTVQGSLSKHDFLVTAGAGTAVPFFAFSAPEKLNQKTLEVRIVSPHGSKLDYIVGAYYLDSHLDINTNLSFPFANALLTGPLAALAPYAPLSGAIFLDQKEKAFSAFGSVTYPLTSHLSATAGIRYTNSKKDGVQSAYNAMGLDNFGLRSTPIPDALQPLAQALTGFTKHITTGQVKDDAFLPSFSLQYKAGAVTFYAKYSRGFKAGGFDSVELTGIAGRLTFSPETVNAYEVGLKSMLFNRTLRFNLAVFRSDYKNLQQAVAQFTATSAFITVTNVGGLKSQGIEADLEWRPNRNWHLAANLALLDTAYRNYANAGCTALQALQATQAGQVGCAQNLTGRSSPFSPVYSGNLSAGYTQPVGRSFKVGLDTMLSFSGAYDVIADKDPNNRQAAWQTVDARLSFGDIDNAWQIALVGKNLTDEKILGSATDAVASAGSYTRTILRGRQIAVQARYQF